MATKKKAPVTENNSMEILKVEQHGLVFGQNTASLIDRIHAIDTDGQKVIDDDALVDLFQGAIAAESAAFVVRGAAAFELVERAEKQGQAFTTTKGNGVSTVIQDVVRRTNVKTQTIQEDFRIYQLLSSDMTRCLREAPETLLPRELYRMATQIENVTWATPLELVDYFREQRESLTYTSDHARRDVKRVNGGMTIDEVREADAQERADVLAGNKSARLSQANAKMLTLRISKNPRNSRLYEKIINTHGSFDSWFTRRASEEFGEDE